MKRQLVQRTKMSKLLKYLVKQFKWIDFWFVSLNIQMAFQKNRNLTQAPYIMKRLATKKREKKASGKIETRCQTNT